MSAAPSLPDHPCFPHLVSRLHVEQGTKLASGNIHRRVELDCTGLTERQLAMIFAVRTRCPACGAGVSPFRRRFGKAAGRADRPGRLFVALACPLDVHIGCSRGKAASDATAHLAEAIEAHRRKPAPPPRAEPKVPSQLGLRGLL